MTLRSRKELEELVKLREEPSKVGELVLREVQVKEATLDSHTKNLSKSKAKGEKKSDPNLSKHSLPLPYPPRLKQEKLDEEFTKLIEQFKQLHINIPLQIP